jgi:serine/threonine protein kinase
MTTSYGKYQVLEQVGEGGFGRVFRALDPLLKREVAIKTCTLRQPEVRARFVREAEIVAKLKHPHIVTVYDFGVEDGEPYLVQEMLTGKDLQEVLDSGINVDLGTKVRWLRQTADGLRHAHSQGVIHRDIKPSNIRIQEDGDVRIMDFGIAKLLEAQQQLTQTGLSIGTTGYLAPEQLAGQDIDHRVDIFSFGVLAYQLVSGRKPFEGDSVTTILYRIAHEEPTSLREVAPDCPPALVTCIERCLQKNREQRWASFGPVIGELDDVARRLLQGVSPVAAALPEEPVSQRRFRISPAGAGIATAAVAVALFGVLNVSRMGRSEPPEPGDPIRLPATGGDTARPVRDSVPVAVAESTSTTGGVDGANPGQTQTQQNRDTTASRGSRPVTPPPSPPPAPPSAPPPATRLDVRRVVVIVRAEAQAVHDAAETTIANDLRAAGFTVVDAAVVDATPGPGAPAPNAIASLGRTHGAGFVVFVDATAQAVPFSSMFTGSASLTARIYDVAEGSLAGSETGAVGTGNTPGKMGPTPEGAAAEAAKTAANQLLRGIRARIGG